MFPGAAKPHAGLQMVQAADLNRTPECRIADSGGFGAVGCWSDEVSRCIDFRVHQQRNSYFRVAVETPATRFMAGHPTSITSEMRKHATCRLMGAGY
jgi:hypothetical protein